MKWDRLDAPDARPFHRTLLFLGKPLAGLLRFPEHGGEDLRVQIALIQRGFTTPDDSGHDAWKRLETSDRANGIRMFLSDGSNLKGQLRRCRERIPASVHGCRARVRFLAVKSKQVPLHSLRPKHDCQR